MSANHSAASYPQLRLIVPWKRRLTSLFRRPLKALARRGLRLLCRRARYPMMYFYFYSYIISTSTYAIAKLGIPDILKDGPKSSDELAELTGTHEPTLYRVLRALAGFHVLEQVGARTFALSSLGETLLEDRPDSLRHWGIHFGDDVLTALPHVLHQLQTGEQAFHRANGMYLWDYLEQDEQKGQNFDTKMSRLTAVHLPEIVKSYDFSQYGTVVDVGGGIGGLMTEILKHNPDVKGILYDRPEVTPTAEHHLEQAGLSSRCRFVSGSFLESVPSGGDAYVLKHVCHDWDDDNVRKILKNCREAMNAGDRLLVIEGFVEHNLFGWDGYRRWCDVYQMYLLLGRERRLDEFHQLLSEAGFQMQRLAPTKIVDVAVLECVAVEQQNSNECLEDEPAAAATVVS